jgi:hypothetical protein
LQQNLADVFRFSALLGADLQAYWDTYKSILQPRYRDRHTPVKAKLHKFYVHVYSMEPFMGMDNPGITVADDDDAGGVDWVEIQ